MLEEEEDAEGQKPVEEGNMVEGEDWRRRRGGLMLGERGRGIMRHLGVNTSPTQGRRGALMLAVPSAEVGREGEAGASSQEVTRQSPLSGMGAGWMDKLQQNWKEKMESESKREEVVAGEQEAEALRQHELAWAKGVPEDLLGPARRCSRRSVRLAYAVDSRGAVIRGVQALPLPSVTVEKEMRTLDATKAWAPGALPFGAGAVEGQAKVAWTSHGKAFLDEGADCNFIAEAVAETYPGGKLVTLEEPVSVFAAGAREEEGVMVSTPLFVAEKKMVTELCIQEFSFLPLVV